MTPSNWINYLAPASGPPPSTVMAFFRWALAGSMPALWLSGLASVLAGVVEVSAVLMLGVLVDAALATSPQNPMRFADHSVYCRALSGAAGCCLVVPCRSGRADCLG